MIRARAYYNPASEQSALKAAVAAVGPTIEGVEVDELPRLDDRLPPGRVWIVIDGGLLPDTVLEPSQSTEPEESHRAE